MSFVLVVNIRIKPDSVDKFMQGLKANARNQTDFKVIEVVK